MSEKNYCLKSIPEQRQWDIMRMVINEHGHRTSIIVEMVEDGYQITLSLLELLYRLRFFEILEQILPYDLSVVTQYSCDLHHKSIYEKALGKEKVNSIIAETLAKQENDGKLKEQQKVAKIDEELTSLYDELGFSDAFFENISKKRMLFKRALEVYDKTTILKGLNRIGRIKALHLEVPVDDLMKAGLFKQVLSVLWHLDTDQRVAIVKKIAQTEDGLKTILDFESEYVQEAALSLGRDNKFTERLKKQGVNGYILLFNADNMTYDEFEKLCNMEPYYLQFYKNYNKSIFWAIKRGYLKYLWDNLSKS